MLLTAIFARYIPIFFLSGQKARAGQSVNKQNKKGNLGPTTSWKDIHIQTDIYIFIYLYIEAKDESNCCLETENIS